jgi:hypothetical protein
MKTSYIKPNVRVHVVSLSSQILSDSGEGQGPSVKSNGQASNDYEVLSKKGGCGIWENDN